MADTPTVSLAGIAELLRDAAFDADDLWAEAEPGGRAERRYSDKRAKLRAAADYAARLAGVLADYIAHTERCAELYGCAECDRRFSRLREFATPAAAPTTETEHPTHD